MTPEERALVEYRLERAHEALDEAQLLFDAGHLHTYEKISRSTWPT